MVIREFHILSPQLVGRQSVDELLRSGTVSEDPAARAYVACVARALIDILPDANGYWAVALFEDPSLNAFALPGGRIGVNTEMLRVAKTPGSARRRNRP